MKDLIKKLKRSGIDIDVVDNELELDIPDGIDFSDIINEVKENKQRLIAYVKKIREGDDFYIIEPSIWKPYYTLSSAQKRMYVLYQFDKTSLAYNMPQFVQIEGALDKNRLESAFSQLIDRHESLRTAFEAIDEEVAQKVSDQVEFEMEYYDSDEDQLSHITDDFVRPFDLSQPPLIRTGIVTVSGDKSGVQPYHILMVDMHHIITDGVSQSVLVNDFLSLYNNEVLPEIRIQYKDYAEWQQGEKRKGILASQKMFWLNEFTEEVTTLELPTDFVRPPVKNHQGDFIYFSIGKEDTLRLKTLCSSSGSTMFMMILSVYNILLSKLSNQQDVVVGTPVACRDHADLENMIGMFVNTLPLRNEVSGSLSFQEFLTSVQQKTLSCFDNQSYQYEELIDELKVGRNTSRNPLFDVLFSYQNIEKSELEISGLALQSYHNEQTVSKFDLTLTAMEEGEELYLNFNYSTALFKEETIERFVGYFKEILSAVISDPSVKLSAIDIMPEAEKQELLYQFNDTTADYPGQETLITLFEKQVRDSPENIALVYNDTELSYQDLNVSANQLARYLRSKGVKAGDVVGLMLDRSIELMVAVLGILKAGGTYLPIDVSQPEERLKYVLKESSALLLLTDKTGIALFDKHITTIDVSDAAIGAMDKKDLKITPSSSDLAYIIYTSGSTGTPKGVMVGHRSVINLICSQKAMYDIDPGERILQFSTIIFDASVEQIWLALLHGAALVLIDKEVITDSHQFNDYLFRKKVTHLHATPSFLDHVELQEPNSLKRIISGGEECKWELANRFNKGYKFYNKYGPSETTITSVAGLVPEDIEGESRISIGKPVNNTFVYVLGHHLELLPRGVKGELYIGGDGLALGYVNREEFTKERFVDNPFRPGERIYKTGDLVRWLPDGNIDFIGRLDDQIKLRGYRIELGEIEHHLLSHEEVKGAVVLVREKEGDKYLVAYYVSGEEIPVSTLRAYLSEKLPDYMVPTYYMNLESMPLTPSGKVDKKALPDPEFEAGEDYVGPQTETEEKLVEIWSEVLKLDKEVISVNKNFFELGGHSLNAVTLANKVFKAFNIELSLQQIFNGPTIKSIAEYIDTTIWLKEKPGKDSSNKTKVKI